MHKEVSEIVNMATTLVLFAVLLLAVTGFYTISSEVRSTTMQKESSSKGLEESAFISRMNHNIVSGSDIANLIIKYKDKYSYVIINEELSKKTDEEIENLALKKGYLVDADYYDTGDSLSLIEKNILNRVQVLNQDGSKRYKYTYYNKYIVVSKLAKLTSTKIDGTVYGSKENDWIEDTVDSKLKGNKYLAEIVKKNGDIVFVYFRLD